MRLIIKFKLQSFKGSLPLICGLLSGNNYLNIHLKFVQFVQTTSNFKVGRIERFL